MDVTIRKKIYVFLMKFLGLDVQYEMAYIMHTKYDIVVILESLIARSTKIRSKLSALCNLSVVRIKMATATMVMAKLDIGSGIAIRSG